jgi:hypothetical protein
MVLKAGAKTYGMEAATLETITVTYCNLRDQGASGNADKPLGEILKWNGSHNREDSCADLL